MRGRLGERETGGDGCTSTSSMWEHFVILSDGDVESNSLVII
jgi:hypothetical protein